MGNLVYTAIASLDGYIEDESGGFDWAMPDDDVFAFINDLERSAGTHLYGRRMYETLAVWETEPSFAEHSALTADFASTWKAADKVVYSRTLEAPVTARTRIERDFDPQSVRAIKAGVSGDIAIAGPDLASNAFREGLVDECRLFLVPWLVGGGKKGLPEGALLSLELMDHRRFDSGIMYLRYRVRPPKEAAG